MYEVFARSMKRPAINSITGCNPIAFMRLDLLPSRVWGIFITRKQIYDKKWTRRRLRIRAYEKYIWNGIVSIGMTGEWLRPHTAGYHKRLTLQTPT